MQDNILLQDNLLFMITNILFSLLFARTEIFFSIICNTPEQWEEQKVVIWTPYYNLFAWRSFTWFSLSHIHIQYSLKHIHMFVCNVVHIFVVCAVAVFSFLFKIAHDQVFFKLGVTSFFSVITVIFTSKIIGIILYLSQTNNVYNKNPIL